MDTAKAPATGALVPIDPAKLREPRTPLLPKLRFIRFVLGYRRRQKRNPVVLLPEGDASAWHKVDADEVWLWHGPASVKLELGGSDETPESDESKRTVITLGSGITTDQADVTVSGHAVVPAGVWQRTVPGQGDALVSCVVSPGFVFDGFTLEQ